MIIHIAGGVCGSGSIFILVAVASLVAGNYKTGHY
jgi:hypothetical protein